MVAAVPLIVALGDPHLAAGPLALVVSTSAGALAISALALQGLLAARLRRLDRVLAGGQLRWHRRVGVAALALVLLHVAALFAVDVDDTLFTLSLDGPTRSRMASLATVALAATVALGLTRGRLPLSGAEWRTLHVFLAVMIMVLGTGHAVWTQGAMDGVGTWVLISLAAVGLVAGLYAGLVRAHRR